MKYISKPLVVEAEQFFPDNPSHPIPFAADGIVMGPGTCDCGRGCALCKAHWIETQSGPVRLHAADWIVRRIVAHGTEGESAFHDVAVMKPHIFDRTYRPDAGDTHAEEIRTRPRQRRKRVSRKSRR